MKVILRLLEQYLRRHPSPTTITTFSNAFKLSYTHSSPYTDAKLPKELYYPYKNIQKEQFIHSLSKKIVYNEKGRIQQSDSFDSILTKQKHEKMLQDDVFGKAVSNKDFTRWVYIAQVKQDPSKSYFNNGKGKLPYQHDLGETYDNIKEVAIFIWDKNHKKIFKLQTSKQLIPSYPSFANQEGSQIIFHAYKRQNFGKGILHCFNRPVKIYHASLSFVEKQNDDKNVDKDKLKVKDIKLQSKVQIYINDNEKTNIFPKLSHDFKYLVYLSGTGITHTYYLDFVINKNINGEFKETHRIKNIFVGYYDTLKTYVVISNNQHYAICQTIQNGTEKIYKIHLQTGTLHNLTQKYQNHHFSIQETFPNGLITGTVTSNCSNSFFYILNDQLFIIDALAKEQFIEKIYQQPIPATYLEAEQNDILQGYKHRAHKRPLLVIAHGGPHGSNVNMLTSLRYILLKLGYGLLFPNFSGSIGYGQKFINNCLKNIGQTDANQIVCLIEQLLKDNEKIDSGNVHIQGGSYGGFMAAIMGSKYSKHFKSAVIMNGVLNIIANLWFSDIPQWSIVQTLQKQSLSQLTKTHYEDMWRQSPTSQTMKIPTLQFLGAKDRRVPYRQGLLFDAITKDVGTPITTYVYEESAHALADSVETSLDIVVKTVCFLQGIGLEQDKGDKLQEGKIKQQTQKYEKENK